MKDIVNLTPHLVRIQLPTGELVELPPSGKLARVAMVEKPGDDFRGIPTVARRLGDIELPPDEQLYIDPGDGGELVRPFLLVSSMVLEAAKAGRGGLYGTGWAQYLLAPDTGPSAVRKDGQVWAVTRLVRAV